MINLDFGNGFRSLVRTVFLCQRRFESPFAMLPDDAIFYVLNMCRWDWAGDDGDAMERMVSDRKREKRREERRLRREEEDRLKVQEEEEKEERRLMMISEVKTTEEIKKCGASSKCGGKKRGDVSEDEDTKDDSKTCGFSSEDLAAEVTAANSAGVRAEKKSRLSDDDDDDDSESDNHDVDNEDSEDEILVVNENDDDSSSDHGNDSDESYEHDGYRNVDPSTFFYRDIDEEFYDSEDDNNSGEGVADFGTLNRGTNISLAPSRHLWLRNRLSRMAVLRALSSMGAGD